MARVLSMSGQLVMVVVISIPVPLMASLPVSTPSRLVQLTSTGDKLPLMSSVPQRWPWLLLTIHTLIHHPLTLGRLTDKW